MQTIDRIIVVFNDISHTESLLAKAYRLADNIGSVTVEILYVHETPLFDIPDIFMQKNTNIPNTKAIKNLLETKVSALDPNHKTIVFAEIDDTPNRVWALAREDRKSLIITSCQAELAEAIVNKVSQSVLIVNSEKVYYDKVLVAMDTGDDDAVCIRNAKEIFSAKSIHLLYNYRYFADPRIELEISNIKMVEERQKDLFETIKKAHGLEGDFFINAFLTSEEILTYFDSRKFDLVYTCCDDELLLNSDKLWVKLLNSISIDLFIKHKRHI